MPPPLTTARLTEPRSSLIVYDYFVAEGHRIPAHLAAVVSAFATVEASFEKFYPPDDWTK